MEFGVVSVVIAVVALGLVLFIAKRVLRLALRLIFIGIVVFALFVITALGWWNGWFSAASPPKSNRPANSKQTTSH